MVKGRSFALYNLGAVVLAAVLLPLASSASDLEEAQKLYRRTNFTGAIELLKPSCVQSAPACALIGQSYLMLGDANRAADYLHKAVALDPNRASYYVWLGRVYGRKAEIAFPLAAPREAAKARTNFEKALELDPSNPDATDDLFEFYLQAPGFLGGGFDKAAQMAERIAQRDAAEGAFAKARLAEERKDYSSEEALLRRAIQLAPKQPRRLLDLAVFLSKRGRYEESDAAFREARKFAPEAPRVLFREASTYIHENRKPDEARELLKQYLASSAVGPDDPSKQEAQKLLRKVSGS
jgi:tetratricopeptide (TPR) repeat protein